MRSVAMREGTSEHLDTAALHAEVDRLKALAITPSGEQQLTFDGYVRLKYVPINMLQSRHACGVGA